MSAQRGTKEIIYDLTPDMEIKLSDGEVVTLAELERRVQYGTTVGAYAPWSTSKNPRSTRIFAVMSNDGLSLHDLKTKISHRFVDRKPDLDRQKLAANLRAMRERRA